MVLKVVLVDLNFVGLSTHDSYVGRGVVTGGPVGLGWNQFVFFYFS